MAVMEEVNVRTAPAPFIDVSYLRSYDPPSFRQQREVRPRVPLSFESSILNVNSEGRYFRTNYGTNNGHSQRSNSRPNCDYCKRVGHIKAKCYKLIGYPQQDKSASYRGQQYSNNYNRQWNKGKAVAVTQLLRMMKQYQGQDVSTSAGAFADPFNEEASGDW